MMPIHDWTRVKAGIFHDFHHEWISTIKRALNKGILPPNHYALAEQLAGGFGPDVLTLEGPAHPPSQVADEGPGGVALASVRPKVSFGARTEADIYATKANRIAIRHVSDDRVIAVIEIVSPGNKSTPGAMRRFVEKASALLRGGVHLMIIDPFPPSPRDPQGIHKAIWDELDVSDFVLPPDRPLTMVSYIGGVCQEAFIEPIAIGATLPEMPLFLTAETYVPVPLETTYRSAWDAVPTRWRAALAAPGQG
jgi:hypothetical protein